MAFNGCESQSERDSRIAKEAKAELLAELKAKEEAEKKAQKMYDANSTLLRMGISKKDGVITIDTNKTKNFFDHMGKQLTHEVKRFKKEFNEGKGAGIEANETDIHIDLHKTENFLERWGEQMQEFANDLDAFSKELDNNQTTP
ncbi:hypothetical protein PGH07_10115 [Sulfurovum sp. zt1-1]|uniref:DUF4142 domain-containing protein n=1 Tax=Sulfurovum zhangzhouensis TaxID=3019067 RepID=A0ABT7R0D8_9BACT|nr:hypothetical protein [Sulfurovum zhangzhouensis]MDM5272530.1 hypothetical protein [Sulfurovum zhangzhouensis]